MSRHQLPNGRRAGTGSFVALPHAVLESPALAALSGRGCKLLLDLLGQFRGRNGALNLAWGTMRRRGWTSRDQLGKARHELLQAGLIELTRQGGRHRASLYGFTWLPIDDHPKLALDVPAAAAPSGLWRRTS